MLSVVVLNFVMLNVVTLSVDVLNVVILNVIMLNVVKLIVANDAFMLSVVKLNDVMPSVLAPRLQASSRNVRLGWKRLAMANALA
jgi:hypothetical protein